MILAWARRLAGDLHSTPWLHLGAEHRRDRSEEEKLKDRYFWFQNEPEEDCEAIGNETLLLHREGDKDADDVETILEANRALQYIANVFQSL